MDHLLLMSVYGISLDQVSQNPILLLRGDDKNIFMPIWIGKAEAAAITCQLNNIQSRRPSTHDFLAAAISELGGELTHIAITHLENDTYYAEAYVQVGEDVTTFDCRPSDAIAVALRLDADIYVHEEVLATSGVEVNMEQMNADPEETMQQFRDFLDDVKPEDFLG